MSGREPRSPRKQLFSLIPKSKKDRASSTSPALNRRKKEYKDPPRLDVSKSPKFRVRRHLHDLELLEPNGRSISLSNIPKYPEEENISQSAPKASNVDGLVSILDNSGKSPSKSSRKSPRRLRTKKTEQPETIEDNAIKMHSFRPGFSKQGSCLEISRQRLERELDQVEQFISIIPPMLKSDEGKRMIPSVEKQMNLFMGSCKQTDENITLLLDSLLDGEGNQQTIANLLQMNERMKQIQQRYDRIRQEFGLSENPQASLEEHSARQLASQLSKIEILELLDQSQIEYDGETQSKAKLEDLVIERGLLQNVDNSDDTDEDELEEDFGEREECLICLEEHHPRNFYALKCSHSYCKYCQKGFIESAINDGAVLSMTCPHPDCKEPFTVEDVANLVPASTAHRYDQFKILAELNTNPNCRWCPRPGCNTAMIAEPGTKILTCSQCNTEICFACKQMWHPGKTCKEYTEWRKHNDEAEENWEKWAKENNAKECPKCGVWIIRPTGCNQVICKSCEYSFCWLCMKECIVPDHYKSGECEGKWFEETNLTTGQKIVAGIILGGVIVLVSPIIAFAGTVALGRKLKKKVKKTQKISFAFEDSDEDSFSL